jgi:hypothetical protein
MSPVLSNLSIFIISKVIISIVGFHLKTYDVNYDIGSLNCLGLLFEITITLSITQS